MYMMIIVLNHYTYMLGKFGNCKKCYFMSHVNKNLYQNHRVVKSDVTFLKRHLLIHRLLPMMCKPFLRFLSHIFLLNLTLVYLKNLHLSRLSRSCFCTNERRNITARDLLEFLFLLVVS